MKEQIHFNILIFVNTAYLTPAQTWSAPEHSLCRWALSESVVSCTTKLLSARITLFSRNGSCAPERTEMCHNFVYTLDWASLAILGGLSPSRAHTMALCPNELSVPYGLLLASCPALSQFGAWFLLQLNQTRDPPLPPCPRWVSLTAELERKASLQKKYLFLGKDPELWSGPSGYHQQLKRVLFSHWICALLHLPDPELSFLFVC